MNLEGPYISGYTICFLSMAAAAKGVRTEPTHSQKMPVSPKASAKDLLFLLVEVSLPIEPKEINIH